MKRILTYFAVLFGIAVMVSCEELGPLSVVDTRFEPVSENIVLPNVPFSVNITETRFNKVIHWTLSESGKLVADCAKVGDLAITDWNDVKVDVVSSDPNFQGVKVKSEGKGVIVEYNLSNGADSLKHFTLKRNKDNKESVKGNKITFYTGDTPDEGHRCVMEDIEAAEFIPVKYLVVKLNSQHAKNGTYAIPKWLPEDHPYRYNNETLKLEFAGGIPQQNSKGYYELNFVTQPKCSEMYCPSVTIEGFEPANGSWRLVGTTNLTTEIMDQEADYRKAYPELNWLEQGLQGVDWDEVIGKQFTIPMGQVISLYTSPKKTKSGWEKTGFMAVKFFGKDIRDSSLDTTYLPAMY